MYINHGVHLKIKILIIFDIICQIGPVLSSDRDVASVLTSPVLETLNEFLSHLSAGSSQ